MELVRSNPLAVMSIMQRCIILRAEHTILNDQIEYIAYSDMFEKIEEGYIVPEYRVSVSEIEQNGMVFYETMAEVL